MLDSNAPGPGTAPSPDGPWRRLLAYSDDRTVWLERRGEGAVVRKVFELGAEADAAQEARLGLSLCGAGFVTYLGAERDPTSGRPSTVTTLAPGRDLWQLVLAEGPFAPDAVAALGIALCGVLRRLHTIAVHRDVKPANVLVHRSPGADSLEVTLLDAEHAWLLRDVRPVGSFSGGTHGWSPPEAYAGTTPVPAVDVFGLGATLWFAAAGSPPLPLDESAARRLPRRRRLAGWPAALVELLVECLAAEPQRRPALEEVARRLEAFLARPAEAQLDIALAALARADLAAADAALAAAEAATVDAAASLRLRGLQRLAQQRRRLLQRHPLPGGPGSSAASDDSDARLDRLAHRASNARTFAIRFPGSSSVRREIEDVRRRLARALDDLPELVARHKRAAEFDLAQRELDAARAAVLAVNCLGGPLPALAAGTAPTPLQRVPSRLVGAALDDLAAARKRHEAMLTELERAEAELNLGAAAAAIDHATAIYSGASEVVANLKDRQHRLSFFLERLAQPRETLVSLAGEVAATGGTIDLGPLERCLERCRQQCGNGRAPKSPLGLRALHRTLRELADELPATRASVGAAMASLGAALDAITSHAWSIADDCRTKLAAVPIPIRPLQNLVARLDHLRLIDALVDTSRGARAELLDEVERTRSDLDQARTTRDRIASGAREAMERGHLTTALYDMARAVDRYDVPAAELEEARKRKHAVEEAMRENHRLAARYAELEDDPTSAVDERIEVLELRRRLLEFLGERVAAERATAYTQDRLDVEVRILQERTAEAERQIDTQTDPASRLRLATTTLTILDLFATTHPADIERLGRVQRIREHWQSLRDRARTDADRAEAAQRELRRRKRRSRLARGLVVTLTLALAVTLYFLLRRGTAPDALATAAHGLREQLVVPFSAEDLDPVQAVIELDRFATSLERSGLQRADVPGAADVVRAARSLVDAVRDTASGHIEPERWTADLGLVRADFERARQAFAPPPSDAALALHAALARLETAAELAAVVLAARACTDEPAKDSIRRYVAARGLTVRV